MSGSKDRLQLDSSRSGKWEAIRTLADKTNKTSGGLGGLDGMGNESEHKPSFMGAVFDAARADGKKAARRKRVLMLMLHKAREMRRMEANGGRGNGWQERQLVGVSGVGYTSDGDSGSDYGMDMDEHGVERASSKDARERRELRQFRTQGYTASQSMSVLVAGAAQAQGGGARYGGFGGNVGYPGYAGSKSTHRSNSLSSIPLPARQQSSSAIVQSSSLIARPAAMQRSTDSNNRGMRSDMSSDMSRDMSNVVTRAKDTDQPTHLGADLDNATMSDKLAALIDAAWGDLHAAQARLHTSQALVKGSAEDVERYDARLRALVGLVRDVESIRGDVEDIAAAGGAGSGSSGSGASGVGGWEGGATGASVADPIPVPLHALSSSSPRTGSGKESTSPSVNNSGSNSGSNSGRTSGLLQPLTVDMIPTVTPPASLPRPPRSPNTSQKSAAPPSPLP